MRWLQSRPGLILGLVLLVMMFGLYGADGSGWRAIGALLLVVVLPLLILRRFNRGLDSLFGQRR